MMTVTASLLLPLPSTNDLIGQNQLHLERRLSEVLFKSESPVFIECGEKVDPIQAVIKAIVGNIAFVQFCDEKTLEEVKLDQLVIPVSPYPTSAFSFDNLFCLRNLDSAQLMKPINSYIQTGHFFELIDNTNPRIVRTVKIIENQNGRVRAVDAAGECHTVLLSSERCKRIGWALLSKNDGHFNLTPFLGTTIKTIVPWFLFDKNQLREHSFELNQVLEVIDPITRYRIIPGVITEIINKYYFRVSLIYSLSEQNLPSIICHKGSPDLLFANFCSRSMLRMVAPDGIDDNNFNIYKIKGRYATENMFDIPKSVERFDTNRRIEIYDETNDIMIPATILRQHRHLLVVRFENQRSFSPPKLYAYYDERVFNVGAAKHYGIELASISDPIDRACWEHRLEYEIVTEPLNHNPIDGRRFMCKAFSDASQFLPRLYINYDCYKGPFINEETARFIDTQIESSHFQPVMKHIIHGVLENVIKFDYQRFAAAQPQSQAPTYTIKLTNPKTDKRCRSMQVEVCEDASEFPDWLRQFLIRLEICPNFISPIKRLPEDACPFGCHLIGDLYPVMLPSQHIFNPSNTSKTEEMRAKRTNSSSTTTANVALKRPRSDQFNYNANNSDHNDLDEPLSTRRGRRNLIPTRRHEIVLEEPPGWKRRVAAPAILATNQQESHHIPGRRRRNTSAQFGQCRYEQFSSTSNEAQNVPPLQQSKHYLSMMADQINEVIRGNLNFWSTNDGNSHSNQEAIKAAAVRKANGGPRMLFPQQMATGRSVGISRQLQDMPPRLQPVMLNRPSLRASVDEDAIEHDEDSYMDEFGDEEDSREAPQLSAILPDSTDSLSVKTEGDAIETESMNIQKPQIQEYLKKLNAQGVKISPTDVQQASETGTSLKLPFVQLEKPGEYDTEISTLKSRPGSAKLSSFEIQELLTKYDMNPHENPANWQNQQLVNFIRKHHSNEVAEFLKKEEFDGQSFFMIEDEEIKDMKLKRGPELNLKRILKELKEISEANAPAK